MSKKKSKEDILNHLSKNGYTRDSVQKILGFLYAKKVVEIGENIQFKHGEFLFRDFVEWYDSDEVLASMRKDINTLNRIKTFCKARIINDYMLDDEEKKRLYDIIDKMFDDKIKLISVEYERRMNDGK